ncbi:MAG: hypothetical protein ACKOZU_08035 [Planctomycetaceae bacterium]
MKALLIVLTAIAILAGLYSGGCSLIGIGSFLWDGPRGEYASLQQAIAVVCAGVGVWSVIVLTANIGVLVTLFGRPSPRRLLLARVLSVVDVVMAIAALWWLVWADSWRWAQPPWTWLAKAAACLLAVKGVLIWRLVGRMPPGQSDPVPSEPRPA